MKRLTSLMTLCSFLALTTAAFAGSGVVLNGTPGPDTVYLNGGSLGNSTIYDDSISGNGGNDTLYANDGDDYVNGGSGDDTIGGGAGNDHLIGGPGNDTIYGGPGNDYIQGFAGYWMGGDGDDTYVVNSDSSLTTNMNRARVIIVDVDGDNQLVLSELNSNEVYFLRNGDQLSVYDDLTGSMIVSFNERAINRFQFSDATLSAAEVASIVD